jgi:hypothetical protein
VVLTLQQLDANISSLDEAVHSMSLDLTPTSGSSAPCEVDLVWMITRPHRRRTAIILAECKDRGPIPLDEFERDVENLRRVADALPRNRLKSFLLLLAPSRGKKSSSRVGSTTNMRRARFF